jgi:ADP-ribose pyrophosphatase
MKELIFTSKNFRVVKDHFPSASTGTSKLIEYIEQPEVVVSVPVMDDGKLVLIEHIRPVVGTSLLECPGGKVDPPEKLEDCITRELEEEIGYTPTSLEYVDYLFTSVGTSNEKIHIFVARGLKPHKRKGEDVGRMQVRCMEPAVVLEMLSKKEIHDAKTEIGLFKYFLEIGFIRIADEREGA